MPNFIYNAAKVSLGTKVIDWVNDTVKVALLTSSYTPNQDTHVFFSDLTNEVTGTGYTAGGYTLSGKTATQDNTNNRAVYDATDVSQTGVSISAYRYLVVYRSTGVSATSNLICLIDLGSNQTVDIGILDITWSASGVFYLI